MEINVNVSHYGKKLEELSKDERTLLLLDTLIVLGQKIGKDNPMILSFMGLNKSLDELISQRLKLTIELLHLGISDLTSDEEIMEHIETSRYGIEKFKKDVSDNTKRIEQHQRMSVLN